MSIPFAQLKIIYMEVLAIEGNDLGDIRKKKEMKAKEEILNEHPYSIWDGANGGCYTYLPDKVKGRVLKKRKTRDAIEKLMIDFYTKNNESRKKAKAVKPRPRKNDNKNSFKAIFNMLKCFKKEMINVSDNTIDKYEKDYNRFFKDTIIEAKDITTIDEEFLIEYIVERIKTLGLTQSAGKKLIDYIKMTLQHGIFKKIIKVNPCNSIDKAIFKLHYKDEKSKTAAERTVSDEQMEKLNKRFQYYYEKKPRYIPVYAVELASMTDFRSGELGALRWDKITDWKIIIDTSEKYNRATKEYYIDTTKNGKVREYPISPEITDLLERVRKTEEKYGFLSDYVFSK